MFPGMDDLELDAFQSPNRNKTIQIKMLQRISSTEFYLSITIKFLVCSSPDSTNLEQLLECAILKYSFGLLFLMIGSLLFQ